jgi:sugar/nucleoside kinase (ribokinase family)
MSKRVWVIGPVAIDRVAYIQTLPTAGSFTRPDKIVERIGGSSGNVAIALATAGIETGFISYVGRDEYGERVKEFFSASQIRELHLQEIEGATNQALVMVDSEGERTIVALTESHLSELSISNIEFSPDDIVVFSLWRPFFIDHLRFLHNLGCTTIVGLEALSDLEVAYADCAIGSEAELNGLDPRHHFDRFPRIVVTRGAAGSDEYREGSHIHQEAIARELIDATGAGDSFLAGFLAIYARGEDELAAAMNYGARWAAATLAAEGSLPAAPPPL